jgi:Zn-dependent metalloprotease
MRRLAFITLFFVAALFAVYASNSNTSANLGLFHNGSNQELDLAKNISYNHIGQNLSAYGLNATDELQVQKVSVDELSMAHARFQQNYAGIPVFGGEAIVHLNADGSLFNVTNTLIPNVNVDTTPTLAASDAIAKATTLLGCDDCLTSQPQTELMIMRRNDKDHLVYRVQLERIDGSRETAIPVYFIDAHTGKKVFKYNNLQTATGVSLFSGIVDIGTSSVGTTFYMEDIVKRVGTFDFRNGTAKLNRFTDTDNVWDSATQKAGVDAHFGFTKTLEYYSVKHGRNGINGSGGPTVQTAAANGVGLATSRVHYSRNYNNAFWDGRQMTYGDGDGTTFTPLVTLDICGHEVTHGVTQFSANLVYANESGALNESMSDVFGALIEAYAKGLSANTWKVGEECYTPANGTADALRYMDNPRLARNAGFTADDDPDFYPERYKGTSDNGGVHINSGIANNAFYLVAAGGTHRLGGSVTGIGLDKAGQIWYKALTIYMTSSTNFSGARAATLNAATVLFGANSPEFNSVAAAWTACGVN